MKPKMNQSEYCVVFAGGMLPAALKLTSVHSGSGHLQDGWVDVLDPAVGIAAIHQVHYSGYYWSNEEEVHDGVVRLTALEHALWTDGTPDDRGVVEDFTIGTGETVGIGRVTQVFDMPQHPPPHADLRCA